MIKMYIGLHVTHPSLLSDFNVTWIFSTDWTKILKYQISLESVQSAELFHANRRTDRHDEANSCFSQSFESA